MKKIIYQSLFIVDVFKLPGHFGDKVMFLYFFLSLHTLSSTNPLGHIAVNTHTSSSSSSHTHTQLLNRKHSSIPRTNTHHLVVVDCPVSTLLTVLRLIGCLF